ncbi:MAG TPA: hypothetical protein VFC65_06780 [Prolixibacteraceae bacterium]|nr:hypothetical protein [Prolixibacteraceae bacterium]
MIKPAAPDMQRMAIAGADLQTAPLNCESVIRFNAKAKYPANRVFRQSGQVVLR